ncbi:addiction module antidote protein, HigA family [Ascidiimonas aurantiaca]|uniref:helix-turn-helix transcriptional regulator n=1 Tax=Ascidiimonas aurantiaca TaxID=1685432 RepID=UPI0030EE80E1
MEKLSNIRPGEILQQDFLKPLEITTYQLSKDLKIPQTRISQILIGNSAKFWLGLEDDYDIKEKQVQKKQHCKESKSITIKAMCYRMKNCWGI